jgi:hypothetical protein
LLASREHQEVEDAILTRFRAMVAPGYQAPARARVNRLHYLQRNFFSSLFLSIYSAVGVPRQRRLLYGQINHAVRGLVTATDNLLDDEYKELLPFNLPEPAIRFKSVMHLLCFDRILEQVCRQAVTDGVIAASDLEPILDLIFRAMVPIGAEEAMEEGGVTEILTPAEVLTSVHAYKGGKLLCLAFTAPLLLEQAHAAPLRLAESGIYRIGMALQVIDDLTDFYEDLSHRNHNYLISAVFHQGEATEQERLAPLLSRQGEEAIAPRAVETLFPATLRRVMAQAIGEALLGFAALHQAGFWYNDRQAMRIIRFLFTIRGVGHLIPFFPDAGTTSWLTPPSPPPSNG